MELIVQKLILGNLRSSEIEPTTPRTKNGYTKYSLEPDEVKIWYGQVEPYKLGLDLLYNTKRSYFVST